MQNCYARNDCNPTSFLFDRWSQLIKHHTDLLAMSREVKDEAVLRDKARAIGVAETMEREILLIETVSVNITSLSPFAEAFPNIHTLIGRRQLFHCTRQGHSGSDCLVATIHWKHDHQSFPSVTALQERFCMYANSPANVHTQGTDPT